MSLSDDVLTYEQNYWRTVFRYVARLGRGSLPIWMEGVRMVRVVVCTDGVVAFRLPEGEGRPFRVVRIPSNKTVAMSVTGEMNYSKWRSPFGAKPLVALRYKSGPETRGEIGGFSISDGQTFFEPGFLSARLTRAPSDLGDPETEAGEAISSYRRIQQLGLNPGSPPGIAGSVADGQQERVIARLRDLEADYERALDRADREEDLQRYLSLNPLVLTLEGDVRPKVPLGEKYVPDFVVDNPLATDHTHLFVEIEDPRKPLFLKTTTQQGAKLTQAIHQTQEWRKWLQDNAAYFKQSQYRGYSRPRFLIVIGRSNELDAERDRALRILNAEVPDREIVTYDHLAGRLRNLRETLAREVEAG